MNDKIKQLNEYIMNLQMTEDNFRMLKEYVIDFNSDDTPCECTLKENKLVEDLKEENNKLKEEIDDLNGMIKFYVRSMKIAKERRDNAFTKKEIDCGIRDNFKEDMIDELYREQDSYETGF